MGARFLSTDESPLPENHKQVIVGSDGHDMVLAKIPDIAAGQAWPRPMARGHRRQLDRSPSDRAGAFSLQPVGRCGDLRTALSLLSGASAPKTSGIHLGRSRRTIENYVYGPDFPLYVGNSLEEGFSPPSPKGKRSGGIKIELNNRPDNNALGVRRRELPQKKGGENNHANAMPVRDQRSET